MRNYPHVIKRMYYEPVAVTMQKFLAVHAFMESRLNGGARIESDGPIADADSDLYIDGTTAIIPVKGLISQRPSNMDPMSTEMARLEDIRTAIDVAEQDPRVERVLFNFETPGGSATGVPETARKIFEMRKPTMAFTDSECCSAGVWLASQAQHFYATPSSRVGSVGVWSAYLDLTKQMEMDGVKLNAVSAGKYKLMGAWWKPMEDEERAMLQAGVDKLHAEFKAAMTERRETAEGNMEGQIFDGEEAAENGMTDGTVEDIYDLLR